PSASGSGWGSSSVDEPAPTLLTSRADHSYGTDSRVQCPGCAGLASIAPPRGMHCDGGSATPRSLKSISTSKARCACGSMNSSCGNVFGGGTASCGGDL